jgi:hypothetical protein
VQLVDKVKLDQQVLQAQQVQLALPVQFQDQPVLPAQQVLKAFQLGIREHF